MTPPKQRASAATAYLVLYNTVSAIAWTVVLGRTAALYALHGPGFVHMGVGDWTKWTQAMAVMEILHSVINLVAAPLFTTTAQIASRLLLVGIIHHLPFLASFTAYTTMLLAWSVTEVIRYSYFALATAGHTPYFLIWLRYSTFLLLYPIGITSECIVIWSAIPFMPQVVWGGDMLLYVILLLYIPGSYIMFTHMLRQRKKVLRNLAATKEEKSR